MDADTNTDADADTELGLVGEDRLSVNVDHDEDDQVSETSSCNKEVEDPAKAELETTAELTPEGADAAAEGKKSKLTADAPDSGNQRIGLIGRFDLLILKRIFNRLRIDKS